MWLIPIFLILLSSSWISVITDNLETIIFYLARVCLVFLIVYHLSNKEYSKVARIGTCLLLFMLSFNSITLDDKKVDMFETEGAEFYIFSGLIFLSSIVNCAFECLIYTYVLSSSHSKWRWMVFIQSFLFHAIMGVSWIGKDAYGYIFESILITTLLILHFSMFIVFLLIMIISKITEIKSANRIWNVTQRIFNDSIGDRLWIYCKICLMIAFWRLLIISFGAINQWWLSMLIVAYFIIYPFSEEKMNLNILKALTITLISMSVFYNSHHKENYYQLKFRDIYIGIHSYKPYITPFIFPLNHFANTFLVFILYVISYTIAKLKATGESEENLIRVNSVSSSSSQEISIAPSDPKTQKDLEVQNEYRIIFQQFNIDKFIMTSYYNSYIMSILVMSIWIKYLVGILYSHVPLEDMDLMFLRTIWMFAIQVLHLIYICQI